MDDKLLLEAVMLAGEIMLESGSEIYRVEDTMNHMLKKSGYESRETIAYVTGVFLTLNDPRREPVTLIKRISSRSTNIDRIYRVNDISRRFCSGVICASEAYEELIALKNQKPQYSKRFKLLGNIGVSAFFAPMFGGGAAEFFGAGLVGLALAVMSWFTQRIRLNDFCVNACGAFAVAVSAILISRLAPWPDEGVMIVSGIMPLVPGVTFTTSIRDMLNGDYSSGSARIMEAIVVALAVAAGAGCGMMLFHMSGGRV